MEVVEKCNMSGIVELDKEDVLDYKHNESSARSQITERSRA